MIGISILDPVRRGRVSPAPPFLALILSILLTSGCASEQEMVSYQSVRARVLNETGLNLYRKGDLKSALVNFQKALAQAEASDNRPEAVRAHVNIGQILSEQDFVVEAEEHLRTALRIADDLEDDHLRYHALEALGMFGFKLDRYGMAEEYLLQALDLAEDAASDEKEAMALNDLGAVYKETGRIEQAREAFLRALFLFENLEGRIALSGIGSVSNNLAALREDQARYAEAWSLRARSLACYQQLGDSEALVTCHANMGKLLELWGKKSDALLRYERAFGVAKEIPSLRWMEVSLENILRLAAELDEQLLFEKYGEILETLRKERFGKTKPP
jgi:tetratricopeptide (TPR) repeat protein